MTTWSSATVPVCGTSCMSPRARASAHSARSARTYSSAAACASARAPAFKTTCRVYEGVVLEDDVFVGPSCVFTNVNNPRAFVSRKHAYLPRRWVAARVSAQTRPFCAASRSASIASWAQARWSRATSRRTLWWWARPPDCSATCAAAVNGCKATGHPLRGVRRAIPDRHGGL